MTRANARAGDRPADSDLDPVGTSHRRLLDGTRPASAFVSAHDGADEHVMLPRGTRGAAVAGARLDDVRVPTRDTPDPGSTRRIRTTLPIDLAGTWLQNLAE